ncbi:MAG: formamidopyrimidine-DNA glycosylase [Proteobacteria bacterium]|jgi:formamidopyrimidine-DNA glycosylase|nr:formamidopyrimidine-DNA glycosylase [Pseudomonadota bacterium]
MPELPDIHVLIHCLGQKFAGRRLSGVRLHSPFVLRSLHPPLSAASGRRVRGFRRLGKRIVFELEGELFLVIHLMIAGRLQLRGKKAKIPVRHGLCAFDFAEHTLVFTEASKKKRASLYAVDGEEELMDHDRGGIDVHQATLAEFTAALTWENHTLKRALTDQRFLSGIGNAYSDEILHRARLSPCALTQKMKSADMECLFRATVEVLDEWIERLGREASGGFLEKITAFRPEMAVHGKYRQPCPECGSKVQRIIHGERESNYCATCQTNGKLLADRALSRLMKKDWPKTLEELDTQRRDKRGPTPRVKH